MNLQPKGPLSLAHVIVPPAASSPEPAPLLMLLHGVGSHERDLISLVPRLDRRFCVVSARGPLTQGPGSYAWFNVRFTPNGPEIDAEEAEQSRQGLSRFIEEVVTAYSLDPKRVYLMGFSQGAVIGLSVALTRPDQVAGVVAMSGRILPGVLPHMAQPSDLAGLPMLVVHGTKDQILPIQHGRASRDLLSGLPVDLTYREFPMEHTITDESLSEIAAWLTARLDG